MTPNSTDFPEQFDPEMEMDEDALREKQEERLQSFGSVLSAQRDEWVRARAATGIDKRWAEDMDQYNSKDSANKAASQMMDAVQQGYPVTTNGAKPSRSTVYIGLTRQKTNSAEARLADIMLPTDDKNWGIKPTPIPELSKMASSDKPATDPRDGSPIVDNTGSQLAEKDVAKVVMDEADKKADSMMNVIDDQLVECDYNSELRKVIHDAAVLGTGILKGPIVTNRTRKAWNSMTDATGQTVQVLEIVEEVSPASFRVDPRNCWVDPACGEDIHNGKGLYERDLMTAKQVRDLAKQPGYMKSQIRKVLEEGPKASSAVIDASDTEKSDLNSKIYEVWTFYGEVDHEDLESAGVDAGEKDELSSVSGCVVLINSTVIKAFLNPLETGDLPFDFYPWEKMSGSPYGYGIPFLMRSQQRVVNAGWRMMMDNAGVSSGPQIVVDPSVITPADKKWELTGRKIWFGNQGEDVRKAFSTFEFNSHQAEMKQIVEMGMQLADEETGVPKMAQGEKGSAPDTLGGMQMLMNAANVVLRRLVKQFDDYITKPHIRRYYDYNMMYSDKEDIKGDFNIDARGSSALIIRDIQNQAFMNLLAAASNPVFAPMIDPKKLFEKALQAQHVDPKDIMRTDDEIQQRAEQAAQQAQQGGGDPRIVAAQMKAQAEQARMQSQQQVAQMDAQTNVQLAQFERAARIEELQFQREIEMLKLAQTKELTLEQIKASLADTAIKERTKKELFAAETRLKLESGSGI